MDAWRICATQRGSPDQVCQNTDFGGKKKKITFWEVRMLILRISFLLCFLVFVWVRCGETLPNVITPSSHIQKWAGLTDNQTMGTKLCIISYSLMKTDASHATQLRSFWRHPSGEAFIATASSKSGTGKLALSLTHGSFSGTAPSETPTSLCPHHFQ